MRLKDYNEKDGKRVWLSERELSLFLDNTDSGHIEMRAAFILAGRCGLRRNEIVQVRPTDLVNNMSGQVVRVWDGKNDKYREPPAPTELSNLVLGMGKDPDEPIVDCYASTVYDWVKRARDRCRAQTGDEGWQFLGPHDLRRSWGVRLLESGVLPSVVMEYGGWEDFQTFRDHYLAEFSPESLRKERQKIPWLAESSQSGSPAKNETNYSAVNSSSDVPGY